MHSFTSHMLNKYLMKNAEVFSRTEGKQLQCIGGEMHREPSILQLIPLQRCRCKCGGDGIDVSASPYLANYVCIVQYKINVYYYMYCYFDVVKMVVRNLGCIIICIKIT